MRLIAGGFFVILGSSLVLTHCNDIVFGRMANADLPGWAHQIVGQSIADKPDKDGAYLVRIMYCCIVIAKPDNCHISIRGMRVPRQWMDARAGTPEAVPFAWQAANEAATRSCLVRS